MKVLISCCFCLSFLLVYSQRPKKLYQSLNHDVYQLQETLKVKRSRYENLKNYITLNDSFIHLKIDSLNVLSKEFQRLALSNPIEKDRSFLSDSCYRNYQKLELQTLDSIEKLDFKEAKKYRIKNEILKFYIQKQKFQAEYLDSLITYTEIEGFKGIDVELCLDKQLDELWKEYDSIKSKTNLTKLERASQLDSVYSKLIDKNYSSFLSKSMAMLNQNFRISQYAIERNLQGTIYFRFELSKGGFITNVKVIRGIEDCPECSVEAIRYFRSLERHFPYRSNGRFSTMYLNSNIKISLH